MITPSLEPITWRRICQLFEQPNLADRHPGWKRVLERCALFDFSSHNFDDVAPSVNNHSHKGSVPLPFPQIAILHTHKFFATDSFWTSSGPAELGANVLGVMTMYEEWFGYYEIVISGSLELSFGSGADDGLIMAEVSRFEHTTTIRGKPSRIDPLTKEVTALCPGDVDPFKGDAPAMLKMVVWSFLRFLLYITEPSRFIVSRSPQKIPKVKKGRIPRLYQRPTYIVLDKKAITTRYLQNSSTDRRSPMPHLRRGHYRILASDRFKEPGKRVWVRATHVKGNTVEWREGDRYYKVV